jgi:hypothetical protein
MKSEACARISGELAHLEREYRSAINLLITVGRKATEREYLVLKIAVDDLRFELEMVRRKLERETANSVSA